MASFESICVQEVTDPRTTKPHILPLYLTSSFEFESIDQGMRIFSKEEKGHVYSRYGNPTVEAVAAKITQLESYDLEEAVHGILFSSGMAALHTLVLSMLQSGQSILTQGNLYGGSTELLVKVCARSGIRTLMTDLTDLQSVETILATDDTIGLVFFESPANPTLACIDMEGLVEVARRHGVRTAVDNTFPTPYLQRPFNYGVDVILHSTTKYLNGHGNSIAGALVGRDVEFMQTRVWETMKLTGTSPGPMDAWLVHQGMKTLPLRMDRHCANALALAEHLEQHTGVLNVNYCGLPSHPHYHIARRQMSGFGGMLSFEVKGGLEAGIRFMRNVQLCRLAPTLG
ncbi:MAG: aminotransferase class I/II-fold pyridoxal phosphate-dependent enzyme, partial [Saprospiraceae bacterium]|nr:aminotransferase class I/II-fold pyridoxal phosphate-dependent enzyme [Saprospiraceae bacterium]